MNDLIVTARLRGLPLSEADFHDLYALHRDERVLAAFGTDPSTAEETHEFLDRKLAHWREHGFGIWMFRDPAGAFVGRCGIHRWSLDEQPEVELGYIVRSELWSQAYATEIAAAVVGHAFSVLALPELVGFTRPENLRSRRVLEKLAFAYERTFVANGEESVLYRRRNPSSSGPQNAPSSAVHLPATETGDAADAGTSPRSRPSSAFRAHSRTFAHRSTLWIDATHLGRSRAGAAERRVTYAERGPALSILVIILIVIVVLAVLGFFGRGRF